MEPRSDSSSNKRNPLIKANVTCPMCKTQHFQYRLNPRMFWNQDRDIDLQPRNYACIKGFEQYHPPLFDMWHCPVCHYTAGHKDFLEPLKNVHIRPEVVAHKFRETSQVDDTFKSIIALLSKNVSDESITFARAIQLNLLAIYILMFIETMIKQNQINLGRYNLRLAWLFRDLKDNTEASEKETPEITEMMTQLRTYWADAPGSEEEALKQALVCYQRTFEDSLAMKSPVDEINILQLIARINVKLGKLREGQEYLMSSMERAREAKNSLEQRLHTPAKDGQRLSSEESSELVTQSRKLGSLADEAQGLIDQIRESYTKDQMAKAKKIVSENPGKTPEQLRALLIANKIENRVVNKLYPGSKKKGLFGKFL